MNDTVNQQEFLYLRIALSTIDIKCAVTFIIVGIFYVIPLTEFHVVALCARVRKSFGIPRLQSHNQCYFFFLHILILLTNVELNIMCTCWYVEKNTRANPFYDHRKFTTLTRNKCVNCVAEFLCLHFTKYAWAWVRMCAVVSMHSKGKTAQTTTIDRRFAYK